MPYLACVLMVTALIVLVALLAAIAAGLLARMDGVSYPRAVMRAAATFAATLTLAAAWGSMLIQLH